MEIKLRNKEILRVLDGYVENFFSKPDYASEEYLTYHPEDARTRGEYYCGREYLDKQLSLGDEHSGAPEAHMASPVSVMVKKNPEIWTDYKEQTRSEFVKYIGAHTAALTNYYPPGGFVGWHTNWNASAYQILFTWSKTGDGYFKYMDNETGEIITVPDVKGWQARHYYFGSLDEPDHHCWHSAYAGCERITFAYKFVNSGKHNVDKDRQAVALRDLLIEELETE